MELNIQKLEQMLYDNEAFKELRNIIKNKKRTIFNIIAKDSDELTFSRTLKYFLDPKEGHNLYDYFLREFLYKLAQLNFDSKINRIYFDSLDLKNCNVYREFVIKEYGRIDIFIELKGEFALVIEIKLYSEEGIDQTKRYEEWAITNFSKDNVHLIFCFLTSDGRLAESENFTPISINNISSIFNDNSIIEKLNQDNKFLIQHFSDWMEELKMTDSDLKKLCQSIYRKYEKEINVLIENAPTITSFVKEMSIYINKKTNECIGHSGKHWLTISPKDWIEIKELRASPRYSKVRIEYNYHFESSNLHLALVIPNVDEFINVLRNKSVELFNADFENIEFWNSWGNKYIVIQKWESFRVEDYINEWDNRVKEFSDLGLERLIKIRKLLEFELKKLITEINKS